MWCINLVSQHWGGAVLKINKTRLKVFNGRHDCIDISVVMSVIEFYKVALKLKWVAIYALPESSLLLTAWANQISATSGV